MVVWVGVGGCLCADDRLVVGVPPQMQEFYGDGNVVDRVETSPLSVSHMTVLDDYTADQVERDSFHTDPSFEFDWSKNGQVITQDDMTVRKRGGLQQTYCVFCYHGTDMLRPEVRCARRRRRLFLVDGVSECAHDTIATLQLARFPSWSLCRTRPCSANSLAKPARLCPVAHPTAARSTSDSASWQRCGGAAAAAAATAQLPCFCGAVASVVDTSCLHVRAVSCCVLNICFLAASDEP